ncbi:DUF2892 domain-containing protein [Marinomonas sp. THO17]|uniref:YgaP family membrane protein n=1 Tax=Marinomonas sp. THO17 TaxID=3149048 RepID=UPI00336C2471
MNKNLHAIDRSLRGFIGVTVTSFAAFNGDYLQEPVVEILLGVFGALNLISLATGWCPIYHLANISTRKPE